MRNRRTLILFGSICLMLLLAAMPFMTASAPAAEEVITVRVVGNFPLDSPIAANDNVLLRVAPEIGKGRVVFKWLGSREIASPYDQLELVKTGAVDYVNMVSGYSGKTSGELTIIELLTMGAFGSELRKIGLTGALDRIVRRKIGVGVLAIPGWYTYSIFLKKPIKSLHDLKGLKLRGGSQYNPILEHYGASPVHVSGGEILTALQTGVIDGVASGALGAFERGIPEASKYQVLPSLWESAAFVTVVNAAWFDGLPQWARDIVVEVALAVEKESIAEYQKRFEEENQRYRDVGMEIVQISDDKWREAQQVNWESGTAKLRKIIPDTADELISIVAPLYPPKGIPWPPYLKPYVKIPYRP